MLYRQWIGSNFVLQCNVLQRIFPVTGPSWAHISSLWTSVKWLYDLWLQQLQTKGPINRNPPITSHWSKINCWITKTIMHVVWRVKYVYLESDNWSQGPITSLESETQWKTKWGPIQMISQSGQIASHRHKPCHDHHERSLLFSLSWLTSLGIRLNYPWVFVQYDSTLVFHVSFSNQIPNRERCRELAQCGDDVL